MTSMLRRPWTLTNKQPHQQQQSQSNRGEGQQARPGSQGYGGPPTGGNQAGGGFPDPNLGGQPEGGDAQSYGIYGGQPGHTVPGADY